MAARGIDLFSIGEFSRVSKISVKALRFYDERDLLKPGHVDAGSGHRYYSSAQLAEANQALDLWTKKEGYAYAGAPREIYLVGLDQVRDEADLRT